MQTRKSLWPHQGSLSFYTIFLKAWLCRKAIAIFSLLTALLYHVIVLYSLQQKREVLLCFLVELGHGLVSLKHDYSSAREVAHQNVMSLAIF